MCALVRQLAPHGVRVNSVLLAGGELTAHRSSAGDAAEMSLSSDASLEVQTLKAAASICSHTLAPAHTCPQMVQTEECTVEQPDSQSW